MPAILRNSLPKLYALISIIGSYAGVGVIVGSRPGGPPCGMVATACGSATLCHAVGVGGVGLRPSLTEISRTDVLGIA